MNPMAIGFAVAIVFALLSAGAGAYFLARMVETKLAPPPSPKPAPPNTALTRKWARTMFHNGLISIEELVAFYENHPPDEDKDK